MTERPTDKPTECCLCGGPLRASLPKDVASKWQVPPSDAPKWNLGHNAWPLGPAKNDGYGRCCRVCNYTKVIPARMGDRPMSSKGQSQMREFIRRLRRQGLRIKQGKKHYKVRRDGNPCLVSMAVSPSDPNAIKQAMRDITRVFGVKE